MNSEALRRTRSQPEKEDAVRPSCPKYRCRGLRWGIPQSRRPSRPYLSVTNRLGAEKGAVMGRLALWGPFPLYKLDATNGAGETLNKAEPYST
jgi:hypothetical protein